ncbi:hypothetical protein, partial [Gluconobacter aidae]
MAGISYSVLPSVSAHAQTSTTAPAKHVSAHKSAARKKAPAKAATTARTAPVAAPAATAATATATAPATQSNRKVLQQGTEASDAAEVVTVTGTRLSQTRLTNVMAGTSL